MVDVSIKLKELRKKHGYTIQAVCDGADIPIRTYQNYEYGKREISAEAIVKLCTFYGVTTDYLLGRSGAKPPEDPIIALCNAFHLPEQDRAIVAAYLYMSNKDRAELLRLLKKLAEGTDASQENDSKTISATTTLGQIEDRIASEKEAYSKDAG